MKRDLTLAAVLAVMLVGWWSYTNTDFFQQHPVAEAEPPIAEPSDSAAVQRAIDVAVAPEPGAANEREQQSSEIAADDVATEAEFLSFVAECRARAGSDPFYSTIPDFVPACVPSDRLIARYNELHVLPYHPLVTDNCREYYSPDPEDSPGIQCQLRPRTIYQGASKGDLLAWAEAGDEVAASLLVDHPESAPQERFDAALTAYRLSGKPAELIRYVELYSTDQKIRVDPKTLQAEVDYEPSALSALNAYVLSRIAKNDGDLRAQPELWKDRFTEHARNLSPDQFDLEATQRAVEALVASRLGREANDA